MNPTVAYVHYSQPRPSTHDAVWTRPKMACSFNPFNWCIGQRLKAPAICGCTDNFRPPCSPASATRGQRTGCSRSTQAGSINQSQRGLGNVGGNIFHKVTTHSLFSHKRILQEKRGEEEWFDSGGSCRVAKPSSRLRLATCLPVPPVPRPKNICAFLIKHLIFNCSNVIVFLRQLIWELRR